MKRFVILLSAIIVTVLVLTACSITTSTEQDNSLDENSEISTSSSEYLEESDEIELPIIDL